MKLMMATLKCSSMDTLSVVATFEAMKKEGRLQVHLGMLVLSTHILISVVILLRLSTCHILDTVVLVVQ